MQVTNHIKKAAAISLAVGSLAVAGLGFAGAASADEGSNNTSSWIQPIFTAITTTAPVHPTPQPTPVPVAQQNNQYVYYINPQTAYQQQQLAYQQAYLARLYNTNYYNATFVYSTAVQNNAALIAAVSEVLNTPAQNIVMELSQGKTLSTIAAQRGWARQSFLNALINRVQVKVANGSISAVAGNALISSLVSQPSSVIDQPGPTWVLQSLPANTWYQIFR